MGSVGALENRHKPREAGRLELEPGSVMSQEEPVREILQMPRTLDATAGDSGVNPKLSLLLCELTPNTKFWVRWSYRRSSGCVPGARGQKDLIFSTSAVEVEPPPPTTLTKQKGTEMFGRPTEDKDTPQKVFFYVYGLHILSTSREHIKKLTIKYTDSIDV